MGEDLQARDQQELMERARQGAGSRSISAEYWRVFLDASQEAGEPTFSGFDGWKLQGYWYPGWCLFLCEIAAQLNGLALFAYEGGTRFEVIFNDGEASIRYIEPDWQTLSHGDLVVRSFGRAEGR